MAAMLPLLLTLLIPTAQADDDWLRGYRAGRVTQATGWVVGGVGASTGTGFGIVAVDAAKEARRARSTQPKILGACIGCGMSGMSVIFTTYSVAGWAMSSIGLTVAASGALGARGAVLNGGGEVSAAPGIAAIPVAFAAPLVQLAAIEEEEHWLVGAALGTAALSAGLTLWQSRLNAVEAERLATSEQLARSVPTVVWRGTF